MGREEEQQFCQVGNYEQAFRIRNRRIMDASCTCKHGTIRRDAWTEGKELCWHIKSALNIIKRRAFKNRWKIETLKN